MPTYSNGYIPANLLVTFASGTNGDGYWEHQLSPGTLAKHRALVARARARTGKTLQASDGWSCYRPYKWQVVYRQRYGNGAAVPGTSSHGGIWEGRQTLAIDYHNWSTVYGGNQAAFFADARAVGLTPGLIMRSRGYPDEPWHLIDENPWAPAPAGTNSAPFDTTKPLEEDDMLMLRIGNTHLCALGVGVFCHFVSPDPYEQIMRLSRIQDDWQDVSLAELPSFLRAYGCDQNIWDVRDGAFVVFDPVKGTVAPGNMWSATGMIRAAVAGIKVAPPDPAPIVAAVREAIAATGVDVDDMEIASNTADLLAKRLSNG